MIALTTSKTSATCAPFLRPILFGCVTVALGVGLVSCAPEATMPVGNDSKDVIVEDEQAVEEDRWVGADEPLPEPQTELPENFPHDLFTVPDGIVIENSGEGDEGEWFLVIIAPGQEESDTLWQRIIDDNALSIVESDDTVEGGMFATLENDELMVEAMTLPQDDSSVSLSYSIALK